MFNRILVSEIVIYIMIEIIKKKCVVRGVILFINYKWLYNVYKLNVYKMC